MDTTSEDANDSEILISGGFSKEQARTLRRYLNNIRQPYVGHSELSEIIDRLPTKVDLKELEIRMLRMISAHTFAIVGLVFAMFKWLN